MVSGGRVRGPPLSHELPRGHLVLVGDKVKLPAVATPPRGLPHSAAAWKRHDLSLLRASGSRQFERHPLTVGRELATGLSTLGNIGWIEGLPGLSSIERNQPKQVGPALKTLRKKITKSPPAVGSASNDRSPSPNVLGNCWVATPGRP